MRHRLLTAAVCVFASLASPAAAQAEDLFATVGPGFTISLRNAQGQTVTQLDPGPYRIVVRDLSDFHNFHLSGPGVDLATDVGTVETVTWEVTFVEGRYTFLCDPHATQMRGAFTVGNPPSLPVRLVATVGPRNTITLTRNGAGPDAGGRGLRDRRARPFQAPQLPPDGTGREPQDRRRPH